MDDVLVLYEYAVKPPKAASASFRWAVASDGRYLRQQNPPGSVRPVDHAVFWYVEPLAHLSTLTPQQLADVRRTIEGSSLTSRRFPSKAPTARGDLARLTLCRGDGTKVEVEVEDQATDTIELFVAGLVRIFLPGWTP